MRGYIIMNKRNNFFILAILFSLGFGLLWTDYKAPAYQKHNIDFNKITICIDPGHQKHGNAHTEPISPNSNVKKAKVTSGTTGIITKVPEYAFNLSLSMKIKQALLNEGFNVIMTREKNEVNLSNIDRAEIANKSEADLFLRIHADGSNDKNMNGISILYPAINAKNVNIYGVSKSIAGILMKSVIEKTGAKSDGIVERKDMTGFNWSKVPVVLLESGFMTNAAEDRKLESSDYQKKIAEGITQGIVKYFTTKENNKK
jgi:N-acetylmuramoyl-L-alanine amidase